MWNRIQARCADLGIAALCFGYFAAYVPYAMMTKMITRGLFAGMHGNGYSGFIILPVTVLASFVSMYFYLSIAGWWRFANHRRIGTVSIPWPRWYTFISGICTAGIIVTTTLAYTFNGLSIVFAMLLMRGGVLALAPIVDVVAIKRRRQIYWPSWIAASLSLGALFMAFAGEGGMAMTVLATIDVALYLASYFLRLYFMSTYAKSHDVAEKKGFFTEEQMVANPVLFLLLFVVGLVGRGMDPDSIPGTVWQGFVDFPFQGLFWTAFLIGILSYGTGLFGSLICLDRRENTFTVPANRAASVVSGVIGTYLLAIFYGQRYPDVYQLIGVVLIVGAIFFLAYRNIVEKRRCRTPAPSGLPQQQKV